MLDIFGVHIDLDPLYYIDKAIVSVFSQLLHWLTVALIATTTARFGDAAFRRVFDTSLAISAWIAALSLIWGAVAAALIGNVSLVIKRVVRVVIAMAAGVALLAIIGIAREVVNYGIFLMLKTMGDSMPSMVGKMTGLLAASAVAEAVTGGVALLPIMLLGLIVVMGLLSLWIMLAIVSAVTYVVAVFVPMALVASPRIGKHMAEILLALVLAPFVIVTVLAVGVAIVAGNSGGVDLGAQMAHLIEGAAIIWVAVYSPFSVLKHIPLASGAMAAMLPSKQPLQHVATAAATVAGGPVGKAAAGSAAGAGAGASAGAAAPQTGRFAPTTAAAKAGGSVLLSGGGIGTATMAAHMAGRKARAARRGSKSSSPTPESSPPTDESPDDTPPGGGGGGGGGGGDDPPPGGGGGGGGNWRFVSDPHRLFDRAPTEDEIRRVRDSQKQAAQAERDRTPPGSRRPPNTGDSGSDSSSSKPTGTTRRPPSTGGGSDNPPPGSRRIPNDPNIDIAPPRDGTATERPKQDGTPDQTDEDPPPPDEGPDHETPRRPWDPPASRPRRPVTPPPTPDEDDDKPPDEPPEDS